MTFIGYQSARQAVQVPAGETVDVEFELVEQALMGDEVVVVGSRTVRTALETPAPVDVLQESETRQSGETEISRTLRQLAPSFNASHQSIADGSGHINPASLRGLGPDQVLVLVKGKRRHSSALVHVNGTFGRGTAGGGPQCHSQGWGRAHRDSARRGRGPVRLRTRNHQEHPVQPRGTEPLRDRLVREQVQPAARYNLNRVGNLEAATYYGSVKYKPRNKDHGKTFGGKTLIDLGVA